MIKRIGDCPYCRQGEIAYDLEGMEVIVNPDSARGEPCCHLVCAHGMYSGSQLLPDGTRRVGLGKVCWQHQDLAVSPQELYERTGKTATAGPLAARPFVLETIDVRAEEGLSREEMIRWFDEAGWDQASEQEAPHREHRLEGWIVYAQNPSQFLAALRSRSAA